MMTRKRIEMPFAATAIALGLSCSNPPPDRQPSSERDTAMRSTAPTQHAPTPPDSQLARFLRLAVATWTRDENGIYDSVYTCREDEDFEDFRWIADFRILSMSTDGDTAQALTILTTVADQLAEGDGRYRALLRIAEDTAHWRLIRTATGPWKVCGDTFREHFNVFMAGRHVRWQPPGASAEKARALIDSIRQSRGLLLIR